MKNIYITYCDRNYFIKFLILRDSLYSVDQNAELWLCCMEPDMILDKKLIKQLNNVQLITITEIEHHYPELSKIKNQRSNIEYYWTLTPFITQYVQNKTNQIVTYLDSDLRFYSDPSFYIHRSMNQYEGDVLIHEHRFIPELMHLKKLSGTYNVGLITFNSSEGGRYILDWWKKRCFEWCYWKYEDGKMGDQMYLDYFQEHANTIVEQNKGFGLAPWNVAQYCVRNVDGNFYVDYDPLIFYHFHALDVSEISGQLKFIKSRYSTYKIMNVIKSLYLPYIEEYKNNYEKLYGKTTYYSIS